MRKTYLAIVLAALVAQAPAHAATQVADVLAANHVAAGGSAWNSKLAWRGSQVYKLKVTFSDGGAPSYVYLDAKTFLVSRVVNSQFVPQLNKNIELEIVYEDYRDVDGLKWAYSEKSSAPEANFSQTITWSKIEINPTLDEADFKGPTS